MRIEIAPGLRLFVDVEGPGIVAEGPVMREKPTLVLLHGGPGYDHSGFKPLFSRLAEVAQIVYYDHRGHGRSDRCPPEEWTLDVFADDVVRLCDALDLISKRHPGLLLKFGGHSMAAGCTIARADFETLAGAFRAVAQEWLSPASLARVLATDGPLALEWFNTQTVAALEAQVWGQGFEAPTFCDEVDVVQQRLVGEKHLKLRVRHAGTLRDAIWFGHAEPVPERVRLAYRVSIDEFQGQQRLQMVVEAAG